MVKDYDRTLATILIANTLVNTALATIGTLFFTPLIINAETATWVATGVIGLTVLIFGELLPKTIAKAFLEKFSFFSAYIYFMNLKNFVLSFYLVVCSIPHTFWRLQENKKK